MAIKFNIFLSICVICAASLSFCAANEAGNRKVIMIKNCIKYISSYDSELLKKFAFEDGDSFKDYLAIISQEEGRIYLKSASLIENNQCKSHLIVDKIYQLCKNQDEKKISEAEALLTNEQALQDSPVHHCIALMCLGQAYCKFLQNQDKAISYFTETFDKYKFSGAALALWTLRITHDSKAGFYYIKKAQDAGLEINISLKEMVKVFKLEDKDCQIIEDIIESEK